MIRLATYLRQYSQRSKSFSPSSQNSTLPPYTPVNAKAAALHASIAKINLLPGGNQSGKTTTVSHDHVMRARAMPPGCQGLALTNTYKDIGKQLWPHYRECLAPEEYTVAWQNFALEIPNMVRLKSNGYKFFFGSYDQGRAAHQGAIWDYLHLDEEAPYDIWLETYRGTLAHGARIGYSYSPIEGYGYIDELIQMGKDPTHPNYWTPQEPMSLFENPYVSEDEKATWVSMLSENSARARIYGYAANPEGLVYKEFNHEKHIIAPFPIPNDWRFYRGLDFGKEHPTVSLVMATDGYTMYVIDEYYQRQRLVDYHVQQMAEQHKRLPLTNSVFLPSLITISDHDAQLRMEYEARGVSSIPAQKERISGVETVQSLFSQDRIKIFSTCQKTIWELGKYHYPGEDGKGRLKPGEKADDPVKEYDDCLDTLRYCCVQEFGFLSQRIYDIISVRKGNML
jgi:hypothetical protein